jgi:hypothetical protein
MGAGPHRLLVFSSRQVQDVPQLIVLSFSAELKAKAEAMQIVTMTPEEYIGIHFSHSKCVSPQFYILYTKRHSSHSNSKCGAQAIARTVRISHAAVPPKAAGGSDLVET